MSKSSGTATSQKTRRQRISSKQRASRLYQLWHLLQDMKAEAEGMQDKELGLLVGMMELLVEERTATLALPHGAILAAADTTRPN
ncbi:MAG: hypothetical protein ACOY4R_13415 [Pseudomonadota bacterium]